MSTKLSTLYLWREIDGERKRFEFKVDANMTIHSEIEKPEAEYLKHTTTGKKGGKQTRVIKPITEEQKEVLKFFSTLTPCWFEGCEELRSQYQEDLKERGGDKGCTSCQKGALMREYMEKVAKALGHKDDPGN